MTKPTAQTAHKMIGVYKKLYKDKYGNTPVVNAYRDKWGMLDMLESLGEADTRLMLEYHLSTGAPPTLDWLYKNFDVLYRAYNEKIEDERNRERLRQETKKYMEELNEH